MYVFKKRNSILLILSLLLVSNSSFSQTDQITIKFIGNCGMHLTDGTTNILVDFPYKSGAFNYMEFDKAELDSIPENSIFLFTHKHPDHYSSKNMRKTLRKKKGQKFGKWNIAAMEALGNSIPDFSVKAIETSHSLSFTHYSYLITWHGKRLYFYDDTETADIALTQKNLDWAFVPYWTAIQLQEKEVKMDTKMLGVYHFYPKMTTSNQRPESIKLFVNQGERVFLLY